nr:attachment glycoprotein [Jingmen Apodemus agrarius jeilongvirus 2]
MNPVAMSNFYGINQGDHLREKGDQPEKGPSVLTYVSLITGLLSLFTIIALNVTNIIYLTGSGGTMATIKDNQQSMSGSMRDISGMLIEDLKPKTDLINSMVSYTIPSQISAMSAMIKNEVLRQCTPSYMFNNTICPIAEHPVHTSYFEEVGIEAISMCTGTNRKLVVNQDISFVEYPSFVPGSTKPGGCVRLPSFSLGLEVFAYAHAITQDDCTSSSTPDYYFSVGRVADHGTDIPVFETLTEWFLDDKMNRRSCSVTAAGKGGWLGCSILTGSFTDELTSPEVNRVSLSYMDAFGKKKDWLYTGAEIRADQSWSTIFFSVGSGVMIGDTVYFLVWGGLNHPINVDAMCRAPGCQSPTQSLCNYAIKPQEWGGNQIVNGILHFKHDTNEKPTLHVRTLSPDNNWMGAEGRLFHFHNSGKTFIYTRSSTWHALPQVGVLTLGWPLSVQWVDILPISRPGQPPCEYDNRCPHQCVTGVYTDLFPIGVSFEYAVTAYLDQVQQRMNPKIAIVGTQEKIYERQITNNMQHADYTTTSCFAFKLRVWCVSIVEMSPGVITTRQPVPFLYHLNLGCQDTSTGSTVPLDAHGGTYLNTSPVGNKVDCYFLLHEGQIYFGMSVGTVNYTYSIVGRSSEIAINMNVSLNQLCHGVYNEFLKEQNSPGSRPNIEVEGWLLKRVQTVNGTKVFGLDDLEGEGSGYQGGPEDPSIAPKPSTAAAPIVPQKGKPNIPSSTVKPPQKFTPTPKMAEDQETGQGHVSGAPLLNTTSGKKIQRTEEENQGRTGYTTLAGLVRQNISEDEGSNQTLSSFTETDDNVAANREKQSSGNRVETTTASLSQGHNREYNINSSPNQSEISILHPTTSQLGPQYSNHSTDNHNSSISSNTSVDVKGTGDHTNLEVNLRTTTHTSSEVKSIVTKSTTPGLSQSNKKSEGDTPDKEILEATPKKTEINSQRSNLRMAPILDDDFGSLYQDPDGNAGNGYRLDLQRDDQVGSIMEMALSSFLVHSGALKNGDDYKTHLRSTPVQNDQRLTILTGNDNQLPSEYYEGGSGYSGDYYGTYDNLNLGLMTTRGRLSFSNMINSIVGHERYSSIGYIADCSGGDPPYQSICVNDVMVISTEYNYDLLRRSMQPTNYKPIGSSRPALPRAMDYTDDKNTGIGPLYLEGLLCEFCDGVLRDTHGEDYIPHEFIPIIKDRTLFVGMSPATKIKQEYEEMEKRNNLSKVDMSINWDENTLNPYYVLPSRINARYPLTITSFMLWVNNLQKRVLGEVCFGVLIKGYPFVYLKGNTNSYIFALSRTMDFSNYGSKSLVSVECLCKVVIDRSNLEKLKNGTSMSCGFISLHIMTTYMLRNSGTSPDENLVFDQGDIRLGYTTEGTVNLTVIESEKDPIVDGTTPAKKPVQDTSSKDPSFLGGYLGGWW